ncbi:hypothetical protein MMC22_007071 [Lobaria immixta]|nr:hypothetical protein [Lobaria immixta]
MDDDVLPPDATAEELMELAIENARNPLRPSTVPSGNLPKARTAKKISPLRFTDAMDIAMYQAMITAHRQGLRCEPAGFKALAWTHIVATVQEKVVTDHVVVKKQCERRKSTQKGKWAEWKRLKTLSGWGFDLITGLFMASDEQWGREIKLHLVSAGLRYHACKYVDKFDELFVGRVPTGENALQMEDILAKFDPVDVDLYTASPKDTNSKQQSPSSNLSPSPTETKILEDSGWPSSENENVMDPLASVQQKKATNRWFA